ncbi:MAG: glycosyltransferase family 1 protein [Gallionellaceae bacterium]|nr:glycosyltransferase family 1 protein [Gallionellaceae bacterium]
MTDAWEPQVNGVVRTLKMTRRELQRMGHEVEFLTPSMFRSIPCPTYPEIALAISFPGSVARKIDAFAPDCLHIATEGPLGWIARNIAIRRGWPFTTAYHSRFPEYVHARFRIPLNWSYAVLRKFHNAARFNLAPTPAIVEHLREQGFAHPRLWSRGVDFDVFRPDGQTIPRGDAPVFLHVGRLAVEKQVEAFLELDLPGEKWVAGDGPERERLHRQYPGVRWFGVLDGISLADLYRSADVFVFPSVTDTFGLVMLESMACGTPVAAFPVAGPIDVVKAPQAGILDTDLRRACLAALDVPRKGVLEHAATFSWTRATEQFLGALQRIRGDKA